MSRVWTLHHYNPGKLKVSDARAIVLDPVPPLTFPTWHMSFVATGLYLPIAR